MQSNTSEHTELSIKDYWKFIITLIFIYVILFEFILPANKILPKPTLIYESFLSLVKDYNLFGEFGLTVTVIYSSLIAAYLVVFAFRAPILKLLCTFTSLPSLLGIFKNFPAFFFAVLFAFWFGGSFFSEIIFGVTYSIFSMIGIMNRNIFRLNEAYLLTGRNMGLNENQILNKIVWKEIQQRIHSKLNKIHFYLWIWILVYEFINNSSGLGSIYFHTLSYNDFGGIFALAISISFIIWFGKYLIEILNKKLIYWD
ncbi:MAG: ABC transporter permease subunit [Bacteroidota bacterium]